jgi:hypothetical protein
MKGKGMDEVIANYQVLLLVGRWHMVGEDIILILLISMLVCIIIF